MKKLALIAALATVFASPPLSALAQRGPGPQDERSAPHWGARLADTPLRTPNFSGRIHHGQLAWRHGRWHHATRNGRFGWWWVVGDVWYYYPEQIEGPPDYVSDIKAVDEATAAHPPPEKSHHTFYYRPGDLTGTPYQTIEECSQASQQAGNAGVCVMK